METLKPSEIYFTQASISSTFGRSTQHNRKKIGETLDNLVEGRCSVQSIPTISVLKEDGKWWTADNRRLWIFRHLEKLGKCSTIPVNIASSIDSRKRTTNNGGTDIRIYRGNDPGGYWHKQVSGIAIPIRPAQSTTEISENTKAPSINIPETKTSTVNGENHTYMSNVKTIPTNILEDKSVVNTLPVKCNCPCCLFSLREREEKEFMRKYSFSKQNSVGIRGKTRKSILKKKLKFKVKFSYKLGLEHLIENNKNTSVGKKKVRFLLPIKSTWKPFYVIVPSCRQSVDDSAYSDSDEDEASSTNETYCTEFTDHAEKYEILGVSETAKSNPFDNWEIETDDENTNESDEEDWRFYDLTNEKDENIFNEYELGYDGDDQYMGSIEDDHYTAVLDRLYSDRHYDSDTDNDILISDYV